MKSMTCALLAALSVLVSGCGVAEQGQSSSLVTITSLQAARGSSGTVTFTTGPLLSDVCQGAPTCSVFDDLGQVTMDVFLKDPGTPTSTNAPSDLNSVTFTQFHVTYRRADGRNTPGVDVPFPFDSAVTFTVTASAASATFELVRHEAKFEAPLKALADDNTIITTIADITFYGKDQAGKNVAVTGSIQVNFGNFADPS
jgi:hypothetical protein